MFLTIPPSHRFLHKTKKLFQLISWASSKMSRMKDSRWNKCILGIESLWNCFLKNVTLPWGSWKGHSGHPFKRSFQKVLFRRADVEQGAWDAFIQQLHGCGSLPMNPTLNCGSLFFGGFFAEGVAETQHPLTVRAPNRALGNGTSDQEGHLGFCWRLVGWLNV